jgi:hypothetical protein
MTIGIGVFTLCKSIIQQKNNSDFSAPQLCITNAVHLFTVFKNKLPTAERVSLETTRLSVSFCIITIKYACTG